MPIATCFGPDGKPVTHRNGEPLDYERNDARRALLSAVRAWWPGSNGRIRKDARDLDPRKLLPPVGARIDLDGEPAMRFERIPVFDDAGELAGTRLDWVDIAAQARDAEEAAALEEMRARLAVRKVPPQREPEPEPAPTNRDIVADPIPEVDGHPLGNQREPAKRRDR